MLLKSAQGKELPYLENELWHKIFAATDLETCRANRIAFHDMLSRDWDAAWTFLFSDSEKDECSNCRPRKPPQEWPMMILLLREKKIHEDVRGDICKRMARYKDPLLLKEARQAGCIWNDEVLECAVDNGSLECLKWAHENGCTVLITYGRSRIAWSCTDTAAKNGLLDILKYLQQNNFPWDEYTMIHALHGGHLNCLKFAHESGCPWNSKLFDVAKARERRFWTDNRWDCVQYLIDSGCPQEKNSIPREW